MLEIICVLLLVLVITFFVLYRREKEEVEFWRKYYLDKLNGVFDEEEEKLNEELKKRQELRRKRLEEFNYKQGNDKI
jgi:hypothetical protein|tara:strand:- start:136 stop:366 length:231 start_codon:yes stop_codon:yes gene_type:complete